MRKKDKRKKQKGLRRNGSSRKRQTRLKLMAKQGDSKEKQRQKRQS